MDRVRTGGFSKQRSTQGTTAKQALDDVASTIAASIGSDPRLDKNGKTWRIISRQVRGYKKVDPPTKHQKALPPEVYRQIIRCARSPRDLARSKLLAGSAFFYMRSCEYSKTNKKEQKTRAIRLKDITFRHLGHIIPHDHPSLHKCDTVSILFGHQKTDINDETVNQSSNNDPEMNPVYLWAEVVRRLRSYPSFKEEWPVYTFFDGENLSNLSSTEFLQDIRATVDAIGPAVLGFTSKDVGTHSSRSGGAMMMYLAKTPVYTIMMTGRWSSNAFLRYIEKQVLEFSKGLSAKMLKFNTWYNVPLKPWTKTQSTFSKSASHFLSPALRQVYGQTS